MFALEDAPAITAATRFTVWSVALATSIITAHFAIRTSGERVPAMAMWGVSCEAFGWFIHQCFYWLWWRAKGTDNDLVLEALDDIRSITSISLVFVVVGAVLIISPFMQRRFGPFWPIAALSIVMVIWLIGYGDIKWRT